MKHQWSEAFDALPRAVGVLRPRDHAVVYANRGFELLTGLRAGDSIPDGSAAGGPDGPALFAEFARQFETGPVATFEAPRPHPDGRVVWLHTEITRIAGDDGEELYLAMPIDVTARHLAEQAHRDLQQRAESRLSALLEAKVLATSTCELVSLRITDANDAFLRLLDWTRAEVAAGDRNVQDFVLPERFAMVSEQIRGLPVGAHLTLRSTELVRGDGGRVAVSLEGIRIDPEHFSVFVADLSDQRRSEAAQRVSQRRFDALWNSGMVGIAAVAADGVVQDANGVYLRLLGADRRALSDRRLRRPIAQASEGEPDHAAPRRATVGFTEPWELEVARSDGTRLPVRMSEVSDGDDGTLLFVSDLSERRRAERQLRATEEQLRHAQKMEAVGRLAGGIAHDFNNLLSIIIGYPAMMLEEFGPGHPMRDDLEELHRAGQRAAGLTRQLLLFSRQQVMQPQRTELDELIQGTWRLLERLIGEDVRLVAELHAPRGVVLADPGHLEQVLMNLAVNARDAMPTGGTLTIATADVDLDDAFVAEHVEARRGAYVRLTVADTGCGMDAATRRRIFEPFFTTKGAGRGTGLGLATVFGIVQQSRGFITVDSAPGCGATFAVYLPRVDGSADAVATRSVARQLGGSETVLLVEDDDQVRAVARTILRRLGYQVLAVDDAFAAERASAGHAGPIHVLLTDVVMPGISGPELARRLLRTRPELKVLCMSGYTDDSVVRHGALDSGMGYLQKPLTPDTLGRAVRAVLDPPIT